MQRTRQLFVVELPRCKVSEKYLEGVRVSCWSIFLKESDFEPAARFLGGADGMDSLMHVELDSLGDSGFSGWDTAKLNHFDQQILGDFQRSVR